MDVNIYNPLVVENNENNKLEDEDICRNIFHKGCIEKGENSCPICLENINLYSYPFICYHSLCFDCFKELCKRERNYKRRIYYIKCPICRSYTNEYWRKGKMIRINEIGGLQVVEPCGWG